MGSTVGDQRIPVTGDIDSVSRGLPFIEILRYRLLVVEKETLVLTPYLKKYHVFIFLSF